MFSRESFVSVKLSDCQLHQCEEVESVYDGEVAAVEWTEELNEDVDTDDVKKTASNHVECDDQQSIQ